MMGLHKLTAGDGYLYLIKQVAAGDSTEKGHTSLDDYYSSKGESPGNWVGSGLAGLGQPVGREGTDVSAWQVDPGSVVTEEQMKALFGEGLHPNADDITKAVTGRGLRGKAQIAAARLGSPFKIYEDDNTFYTRLSKAYADYNAALGLSCHATLSENIKSQIRTTVGTEMFQEEHERAPLNDRELTGFIAKNSRPSTKAVAGYDLTFSPVKSVSALWAIAPREVAEAIEQCHQAAVADVIEFLEQEVIFSRLGGNGVQQVDTDGLIAAHYFHRSNRDLCPQMHSHLALSNKVRVTGADGISRWLAVDGRPLHKATVAASEMYNTRLEAHMIANEQLQVKFEDRGPAQFRKRPVREIVGIDDKLLERWSSRRKAIEQRIGELAKEFQALHHREPTTAEAVAIAQQATLETRKDKKELRSYAEERQAWRTEAIEVLGGTRQIAAMVARTLHRAERPKERVTDKWIQARAKEVIGIVSESRARWQKPHVLAEAQRLVRKLNQHTVPNLAETITAVALSEHSIDHARIQDTDYNEPHFLRRRDGQSVYSTHNTELYTSEAIKAAERRIVAAAHEAGARTIDPRIVEIALLEYAANHDGRELNEGQATLVREMATSGARLQLALAPAGSGKTTAMEVLSRAWQDSGGTVLGLAPTAAAAEVLRQDLAGATTDTVAKLVFMATGPQHIARRDKAALRWFNNINERTMIIVDETGLAGTLELDTVIAVAKARGAQIRTIGDDRQLNSISCGGILRDVAHSAGSLTLTEIVRFKDPAEAAASLALRNGDVSGIGYYLDRDRIHVGADATASDMAYNAWKAERDAGKKSIMVAPTNDIVTELNARARMDRLRESGQPPGREVELADGQRASAGDIICTRENARKLAMTGSDFVRNGYRWEVIRVRRNGSIKARHVESGRMVDLPPDYIAANLTLGYATTIDSAQGLTAFSCHIVGSIALTAQQLYVAITRGKLANHVYFSTAEADPHRVLSPRATHPQTAVDVLTEIVNRDGAQESAMTAERVAHDPFNRLGHAADMYSDAAGSVAEHTLGKAVMTQIDEGADELIAGLTASSSWPALRKRLAVLAFGTRSAATAMTHLKAAIAQRDLDDADDVAAVLHWRLWDTDGASLHPGPLQWIFGIPPELADDPQYGAYLLARRALVTHLADQIRAAAQDWTLDTAPQWARPLVGTNARLLAEIAVFRAAHHVPDSDLRFTGPKRPFLRARDIQNRLESAVDHILGRPGVEASRWTAVVEEHDRTITDDPFWPQLAAHLETVARSGRDVPAVIDQVMSQFGVLPDELPAAALWWRISGSLAHSPALQTPDRHLRPQWIPDLHEVLGSQLAETVSADPAWPSLVAAVNAAGRSGWTPLQLLHVSYEHLRDLDVDHHLHIRPDEYARLLSYRVDAIMYTTAFTAEDIPHPEHEPLTDEEAEELAHLYPDPEYPHVLNEPDQRLATPHLEQQPLEQEYDDEQGHYPDPEYDYYPDIDEAGLNFEDLSTQRPSSPVDTTALDVAALRAALARHLDIPAPTLHDLADLMRRHDEQLPRLHTLIDSYHAWMAADVAAENLRHQMTDMRRRANLHRRADEHDVANQLDAEHQMLEHAISELESSAAATKSTATEAHNELIHTAGGPSRVVDAEAIIRARRDNTAAEHDAHEQAEVQRAELHDNLAAAETAVSRAFATAVDEQAAHIDQDLLALRTELAALARAGRTSSQRVLAANTDRLAAEYNPQIAAAAAAIADTGFVAHPVTSSDRTRSTQLISALTDIAHTNDRRVLLCTTDYADVATTREEHSAADSITSVDQAAEQLRTRAWTLPAGSIVILDNAEKANAEDISTLIEACTDHGAKVILLDNGHPSPDRINVPRMLADELPWTQHIGDTEQRNQPPSTLHAAAQAYDQWRQQHPGADTTPAGERAVKILAARAELGLRHREAADHIEQHRRRMAELQRRHREHSQQLDTGDTLEQ
ncbi:MobF family relaxase [Mycobacteroides abscessus]|uniref:MobF family relaxase n=1 Tax=Mycobacteroides abscessus TaxID=36809 RepID=UPI0009A69BCB|nr:MobF family relaxase [Mycobacteroides abscessus]SKO15540.1 TrwC relaxase [Mycobacteroides abscessus subsp. bolletii]SKX37280.1 TrwC relaxase [Mycobacteroides abscessus subsp. bolletii]